MSRAVNAAWRAVCALGGVAFTALVGLTTALRVERWMQDRRRRRAVDRDVRYLRERKARHG